METTTFDFDSEAELDWVFWILYLYSGCYLIVLWDEILRNVKFDSKYITVPRF